MALRFYVLAMAMFGALTCGDRDAMAAPSQQLPIDLDSLSESFKGKILDEGGITRSIEGEFCIVADYVSAPSKSFCKLFKTDEKGNYEIEGIVCQYAREDSTQAKNPAWVPKALRTEVCVGRYCYMPLAQTESLGLGFGPFATNFQLEQEHLAH